MRAGFLLLCTWFVLVGCQPEQRVTQPHLVKHEKQDQPQEAVAFFVKKRSPSTMGGELDYSLYEAAFRQVKNMPIYSIAHGHFVDPADRAAFSGWTFLGPGNIGGRTRQLVIDPNAPNVLYAAAVAGGVWKSTDAGASWQPLDDLMANLAVNALAIDPGNSQILYAGTGEGFFNVDAVRGAGIFKTYNGGQSWIQLAATAGNAAFHYVNDLKVSFASGNRIYAATNSGVFRSLDGGANWESMLLQDGNFTRVGRCTQLQLHTDQFGNDILYASCYSTDGNRNDHMIWRSYDANDFLPSWSMVHGPVGMARASMALAPSNPLFLYVLASHDGSANADYTNGLQAVYRSADGGNTWTTQVDFSNPVLLNTALLTNPAALICWGNGYYNQGWYDNVIAVDPVNPDRVWAGGIDLFRSDDGGRNWQLMSYWWIDPRDGGLASASPHADQHVIVFPPNYDGVNNKQMYVANDGGIYRATDATAAGGSSSNEICPSTYADLAFMDNILWVDLNNGYGVTQFYHGTAYPGGDQYFAGAQDNGTLLGTDQAGPNAWVRIRGGDGGYVSYNRFTGALYSSYTYLSLQKSTNGGNTWVDAVTGIDTALDGGFQFITPHAMDPATPANMWIGGNYLWRSTDGASNWAQASSHNGASLSAITVSPVNSNAVLAGFSDGSIRYHAAALGTTAATVWPSTTPGAVDCYISSVRFAPGSDQVAYATSSTFGCGHVFRTLDGGANWSDISGNLPDIPAHDILVDPDDPDRLFLATDLGMFVTLDAGVSWAQENAGFANVVVESLDMKTIAGQPVLFAFTHGRGVWKTNVLPSNNPPVIVDPDGADDGITTVVMDEDGSPTAFALPPLTANDADADPLNWSLATAPNYGVAGVEATSGVVSFQPNADYNGNDNFTVQVSDGIGGTDSLTIQVVINPVNDPPSFTPATSLLLVDQGLATYSSVWANNISVGPLDESLQVPVFAITNGNTALFSVQPTIDINGVLSFTLTNGKVDDALLGVSLSDGVDSTPVFPLLIRVLHTGGVFRDGMENP